jgi:uncharacterized NAD(P)/FAD-binding protein YdhS
MRRLHRFYYPDIGTSTNGIFWLRLSVPSSDTLAHHLEEQLSAYKLSIHVLTLARVVNSMLYS